MITISWTNRAQADLAAIEAFIAADSHVYATAVVGRLIDAASVLHDFPDIGRAVEEFPAADIREVILRPYRIVYRVERRPSFTF